MFPVFNDLPLGLTMEQVIAWMAGGAAVLIALAIWTALVPKEGMSTRARALVERRAALKAAAGAARKRRNSVRAVGAMRSVVKRLNLLRSQHTERISLQLSRAGFRSNDAVVPYLFAKATMPFVGGGVAAFLLFVVKIYEASTTTLLLFSIAGALLGSYLPDLYVKNCTQKRQDKLRKGLPDALDLMVICAEAGLSLDSSLQRVSKELMRSWPEVAEEFGLAAVELGFLPERKRALDNLTARTDLPGLRAMVNTLTQTEKFGTPLAQSLRVLASELRTERMMKAEEKAARLPATLTVPMIIFILPPLFIVLIGSAILSTMDAFKTL
jgi:tight adherence protein C